MNAIAAGYTPVDPHAQLRRLYLSLLQDQNRFDEFKHLLAKYPAIAEGETESPEALDIRKMLNVRIGEWIGGDFEGFSAAQIMLWRSIVVEQRINVALSPWRESNMY